jgi:hypothetical protein
MGGRGRGQATGGPGRQGDGQALQAELRQLVGSRPKTAVELQAKAVQRLEEEAAAGRTWDRVKREFVPAAPGVAIDTMWVDPKSRCRHCRVTWADLLCDGKRARHRHATELCPQRPRGAKRGAKAVVEAAVEAAAEAAVDATPSAGALAASPHASPPAKRADLRETPRVVRTPHFQRALGAAARPVPRRLSPRPVPRRLFFENASAAARAVSWCADLEATSGARMKGEGWLVFVA